MQLINVFAYCRSVVVLTLLWTLWFGPAVAAQLSPEGHGDFDDNRAKLVSYVLRQDLSWHHFSHKKIDDDLSKAAFQLYLKQLDFQKRFLLKADVEALQSYKLLIDDEVNQGDLELPKVGARLIEQRVREVKEMVQVILAEPFAFSKTEFLETDPEKLDYCVTPEELRDRWRRILKVQVLTRYLDLLEDQASDTATTSTPGTQAVKATPAALRQEARDKVQVTVQNLLSRMLKETPQEHYDRFFNAVTRAFDPHTNYMPPATKEDFDISMRGSLEGIGALLREEGGYLKVVRVIPGSAADRQGHLQAEDIILKVAEAGGEPVDVTDMRIREAVSLIRGKKGTEVRLTVRKPDGTQEVIPIIRDVVQIQETFVKAATLRDDKSGNTYGYIKIPTFYRDFEKTRDGGQGRNSTDDVKAELDTFTSQQVSGVILDLRNNGGGALTDAVSIAGLFIETGPIVQVESSHGKLDVLSDVDPSISYAGPLVVLVNKFSASASEILAGALQDYGRAIIMGGEHTHGKGTVQTIINLDRGLSLQNMQKYLPLGALKLTIQKFYRVSGASTQYRGVVPDVILPDRLQHVESGEQYLDYSLPWDVVKPTPHAKWAADGIDLALVSAKSRQRVAADPDFIDMQAEAERADERREKTRISLNMADMQRERQEARARLKKTPAGFHGHNDDEEQPGERSELTEAEKRQKWTEELSADPYVEEGMAVLSDIVSVSSNLISASPGGASRDKDRSLQGSTRVE
jgi:carboxyl-terminal processing protease